MFTDLKFTHKEELYNMKIMDQSFKDNPREESEDIVGAPTSMRQILAL